MTDLYLITGFLGAGKSTFLKEFLKLFEGKRMQLVVNEFGAENVDGVLLGRQGIALEEITGGSIFCSCRIDQFEKALRMTGPDTEVVIVEASGLSDPTLVRDLLHDTDRFSHIRYRGSICLIDAVRFEKTYEKSLTCVRQLAAADVALINKVDRASAEELEKTRSLVRRHRPDIPVFEAAFGKTDGDLQGQLNRKKKGAQNGMPLTEDLTIRKLSVHVRDGVSGNDLKGFLKLFVDRTFRVKGFVRTDGGLCLVDCVGNQVCIEAYEGAVPPERCGKLVVLSGAGMPVRKYVNEAVEWYREWFFVQAPDSRCK